MAQLSDIAIAGYAASAGFTGPALTMAVAIALAESGGDPGARGLNRNAQGQTTSVDRGLWQINSVYHPEVSDTCAYNPACAANSAYTISNRGQNWQPWSTFSNGAYKQYMSRGLAAAMGSGNYGTVQSVPPTTNTTSTSNQTLNSNNNVASGVPYSTGNPLFDQLSTTSDISYQTMGDTTKDVMQPYRILLALAIIFGFIYAISRTRAGYTAVYYAQVLILFFLFATQSAFFKESLLPLANLGQPTGS